MELTKEELDCEKWKLVPSTSNLYVSDMGRVKRILKDGREKSVTPFLHKYGKNVRNTIKVNYKLMRVSQLVWVTFNGGYDSNKYNVCYIGSTLDDRLCNLKLLTKSELLSSNKRKIRRGIYKVNISKKIIYDYYPTCEAAAKDNYCSTYPIFNSCTNKGKTTNCTGYNFIWADKLDNNPTYYRRKGWKWENGDEF